MAPHPQNYTDPWIASKISPILREW
ncbi:hypothetical protein CCACVL1_07806 [Corchorus capsularis]|uniref:Uncharacterized protein n=1 Tax=Corchorus capsularis TaxID=210143 RepID=A0A1R3J3X0_COCAP|nr:hypothetical protein CCACVL1_07806 [Corchorus capsularis]